LNGQGLSRQPAAVQQRQQQRHPVAACWFAVGVPENGTSRRRGGIQRCRHLGPVWRSPIPHERQVALYEKLIKTCPGDKIDRSGGGGWVWCCCRELVPPCARGEARQPGSINRGVLQTRPGAPNGTSVRSVAGAGSTPHTDAGPPAGVPGRQLPGSQGSLLIPKPHHQHPEQEAAVEITARKSRGALLHPHGTAVLFGVRSRASKRFLARPVQSIEIISCRNTNLHGSCRHLGTANQQPCILRLRLADAKSIGPSGR
jgi:hypothetical protein